MAGPRSGATDSGVTVYPPLPVPKRDAERPPDKDRKSGPDKERKSGPDKDRKSGPDKPRKPGPDAQHPPDTSRGPDPRGRRVSRWLLGGLAVAVLAGGAAGAWLRPIVAPDPQISALEHQLAETEAAAAAHRTRADGLARELAQLGDRAKTTEAKLATAEQAETQLARTAAAAEQHAKDLQAIQQKLATSAKGAGTPTIDGELVRLVLPERLLFKGSEDQLSDRGRQLLDRISAALRELPDRQIWVQGHTDDTPIPLPRPAPASRGKAKAPAAAAEPPVARFPTHWELAGARALAVVHHFQDVAKLDPTRLVALSFGQYRPITRRTDKPANRRIELVLAPRPAK
ncbi:MAG: OmpA/MotB family protein [Kofleriaceae bacterium]